MLNGRGCSRGEGVSALSTNDHLAPEDVPVLDLDACRQRRCEFGIFRRWTLESGIVLHVHHLYGIPRDGNNLGSSLVDHRNFCSAIHRTQKRLFLTSEDADCSDPSLGRSVLAWLRLFKVDNAAGLTVNDHILPDL